MQHLHSTSHPNTHPMYSIPYYTHPHTVTHTPETGVEQSYRARPYIGNNKPEITNEAYKLHQCPCTTCKHQRYHRDLEIYYQQQKMASEAHEIGSRFRFHDMAHGNTLTDFYSSVHWAAVPELQRRQYIEDMQCRDAGMHRISTHASTR